jgi:glycosyltransferase involved in cell wall biosynthesis
MSYKTFIKNMKKRVLVAHPGKQHVFQLVTALEREGLLHSFVTTIYDKEDSITSKVKKVLRGKILKKASSRRCEEIPDNKVHLINELGGLFLRLLSRLTSNKKIINKAYHKVHSSFSKKVAYYALKEKINVIILFDSNVYDCFQIIKAENPNILCLLDVTIANRVFMKTIYDKDIILTNNYNLKKEQIHLWNPNNLRIYEKEFFQADFMLVGSSFVKKSIEYSIGKSDKILHIPYGVNLSQFKMNESKNYLFGPLLLFFVGGVILRKGIHHLLEVVSSFSEEEVQLVIAGHYDTNDEVYKNYKDFKNIKFEGFVTRDVIAEYYQKSHVFVLPSLAEGMALVGLEALASGLPIICTDNTGVNDIVINGENGFVIPTSNQKELKDKIIWMLEHRENLKAMGKKAVLSAKGYSWSSYHNQLIQEINKI